MMTAEERRIAHNRACKKWRDQNPDKQKAGIIAWKKANPEKVKAKWARERIAYKAKRNAYSRKYHSEHAEERRRAASNWRKNNLLRARKTANARGKERRTTDINYRIAILLRNRMRNALKEESKVDTTMRLLGCSVEHLKVWLTFWFQPGMSLANYGKVWQIDHDRPCASFNLVDPAQQRECFHYTNLRPLFAKDNLEKGDKWEPVCAPDPSFNLLELVKT